jgi:hypothetical protein
MFSFQPLDQLQEQAAKQLVLEQVAAGQSLLSLLPMEPTQALEP